MVSSPIAILANYIPPCSLGVIIMVTLNLKGGIEMFVWQIENQKHASVLNNLVAAYRAYKQAQARWEKAREQFLRLVGESVTGVNPLTQQVVSIALVSRESPSYSQVVREAKSLLARAIEERNWELVEHALNILQNPPTSISQVVKIEYK